MKKGPLGAMYGDELQTLWGNYVETMKGVYEEAGGNNCVKECALVRCPTLIVHGAKDPVVPQEQIDFFTSQIGGSKLHVYPEGKHNPHMKFAEDFNERVVAFFKEGDGQ